MKRTNYLGSMKNLLSLVLICTGLFGYSQEPDVGFINNLQLQLSMPSAQTSSGFGVGVFANHYITYNEKQALYIGAGFDVNRRSNGGVVNFLTLTGDTTHFVALGQIEHETSTWVDLKLNIGYKRLVLSNLGFDANVHLGYGTGSASGLRIDTVNPGEHSTVNLELLPSGGGYIGLFYRIPIGKSYMNLGLGYEYNATFVRGGNDGDDGDLSKLYNSQNYAIAGSNATWRFKMTYVFGALKSPATDEEQPVQLVVPTF